ncbi:MAG: alpha/beta fold hydrolase [Sphingomonas sp.]|uniref:alpha/beta fold hydrolase n=1 Tax=Sphingomonas sp. TaxID=28214 RepID=UPI001B0134B9|nr:alpha/beta fold hydrolase [Sphingomonas sp.]MBO9621578.1 alpha/beta fold hydrolase [Sphingomonas sp.]
MHDNETSPVPAQLLGATLPSAGTLSHFTTGDGVRIAYREDGSPTRPALVLSNSIGTTLDMWGLQVPAFAEHFRVIRYDFRGHGASDVPAGAYSDARLGRDVLELLDHLGIARAHFLGLSLGGFVGQWLGIHAPERIERLVLSNTAAHLGPPDAWDSAIAGILAAPDMAETAEMFLANWFPKAVIEAEAPIVAQFREQLLRTSPRGLAGCLAVVRDTDLRRTIALIPNETLVIAGRFDTVTSAERGEEIARTIPGASLVMLPAVHLPNVELAEQYSAAVIEFLTGAGGA